ncbi:hypothetical protein EVAR_78342_1 [Eumeta japonica]|uniref:Uncharacterized protein n=1 Tax=Eumeta variegata TaxID=151549 RepID=A0A4C1T4F3_EUMVA|nr:hypothetical protein EVAR_78342_1 [Eumeta japonica]
MTVTLTQFHLSKKTMKVASLKIYNYFGRKSQRYVRRPLISALTLKKFLMLARASSTALNIESKCWRDIRARHVEITGLPETNNENPVHLAIVVAQKLGVEMESRDIVSVERVGVRRMANEGGSEGAGRLERW